MRVDALFVDTPATPLYPVADLGEGELDELAHRVSLAGRQHIIIRLFLLQDQPHPPRRSRAHDLSLASRSDCRVVVFADGRERLPQRRE